MKPLVGIIMGSDSDLPVMQAAAKVLNEFGIESEVSVLSAHRTPEETAQYVESAVDRGIKVIIAGAGGAAHLAGVAASLTPLPVIGVPMMSKALSGIDSLFATVQMPSGVPVATVAIGNAKNAGILAAEIIGASNPDVQKRIVAYKKKIAVEVMEKNEKFKGGFKKYLEEQGLI